MLTPTDYIHQEVKLPKLVERRKYHAQIVGFKRSRIEDFVTATVRQTRTNVAPVLNYRIIHCAAYERALEVYVSRIWNALKPEIRLTEDLKMFKILMKKELENTIPTNIVL